jgi:predicted negative regulator of RcsB-dependent stress response
MAEDKIPQFAEDDDLARARAFWKENGRSLIFGVVLGLGGIVGFNYWNSYQQNQSENASELFDKIRSDSNLENTTALADEIKSDYPKSAYSALGAFYLAKILVENDKLELAENELKWVVDNSQDEGITHVARIRLASVYLAMGKADNILELLTSIDEGTFTSRYQELMGDAYAQRNKQGDLDKAKESYESSLSSLPESSGQSGLLQLKIDNLGAS